MGVMFLFPDLLVWVRLGSRWPGRCGGRCAFGDEIGEGMEEI